MSASEEQVRSFCENLTGVSSKTVAGLIAAGSATALGAPLVAPFLAPYLAHSLERMGKELVTRQLGPRQELRASALYILAAKKINERQASGKKLRDDGFFSEAETNRSVADEVTEAVFNTAMKSYQEKRIPYLANLFANICFDDGIEPDVAHTAVQIAESLSYRDFNILKVTALAGSFEFSIRPESGNTRTREIDALLAECFKLSQLGLVAMKYTPTSDDIFLFTHFADLEPKYLKLHGLGQLVCDLLEAHAIPDNDNTYLNTVDLLQAYSHTGKSQTILNGGKI